MTSTNLMEAHTQWATRPADQRFADLDSLQTAVSERRANSRATDIQCEKLEAKYQDGKLLLNGTIQASEPSHWAFGQLAQHIGAPANYLRGLKENPALLVDNLNFGIRNNPARDAVKFMTIANPETGDNTLQAVTSTTYGRIWDADCVAAVRRIVEKSNGAFQNPLAYGHRAGKVDGFKSIDTSTVERAGLYASDRDVFMFLIDGGSRLEIKDGRGALNRGFMVWNSEVGSKTFGLKTFLFRECCGNNIIYGAQNVLELLIRHSSGGPSRFDLHATPTLQAYVQSSAQAEEAVINRAVDMVVTDGTQEDVSKWLTAHGKFTKAEQRACYDFARAEEGDAKTLWQLVQGGTAYARGIEYVDARVDVETRFGKLLAVAE